MTPRETHVRRIRLKLGLLLLAVPLLSAGCSIPQLVGGMLESDRRNSTRTVEAVYEGLADKSFAVVVAADRSVAADYPGVVPTLTNTISERIRTRSLASGFVPPDQVLKFQTQNPRWEAMRPAELAETLANVDRLIFIDLQEFRLSDPGNPYLWAGTASALVGVIESDSRFSEEFVFTKQISVTFPDQDGFGPSQIPQSGVELALARRFIDRVSWLFYEHEEPHYIKY